MSPRKKQLDTNLDIAGVVGDVGATRSGHDVRKRGWYWHWNATVTQFAPLIGLKGVGLLNSYTVWTDRREESPTRGYAFPSQQSEADFYGEDRAELITINKILVALDLIEIRKEMVVRPDEQGRRWKVPHNFYRVKDRDDGYTLDGDAVMRVVRLADKDKAVYRYLHHIFSEKFRPIDAQNVWSGILAELRHDPIWQKLAARTAADERRATERTKLGHASRKERTSVRTLVLSVTDSATVASVTEVSAPQTSVAKTNKGVAPDVEPANNGLEPLEATNVAPAIAGSPTIVAPSNTTYHQEKTTTTTSGDSSERLYASDVFVPENAPLDQPNMERTLRRFADANGREATAAERKILKELAERFDLVARESGRAELASGWSWVSAAIYEAVDSGSAYVAPKRVREILLRWERDGLPSTDPEVPAPHVEPRKKSAASRAKGSVPAPHTALSPSGAVQDVPVLSPNDDEPFSPPVFAIGGGLTSTQAWSAVLALLRQDGVTASDIELWLRPLVLLERTLDGESNRLLLGAPNRAAATRVEQRFAGQIESAFTTLLGRDISVTVTLTHDWLDDRQTATA